MDLPVVIWPVSDRHSLLFAMPYVANQEISRCVIYRGSYTVATKPMRHFCRAVMHFFIARRPVFSPKVHHSPPCFEAEKYIRGCEKYITGRKKYITGCRTTLRVRKAKSLMVSKAQEAHKKHLMRKCTRCLTFTGGETRIRTGDKGFAGLCLTTWPSRQRWRIKKAEQVRPKNHGAGYGVRTRDLNLGKVARYQLR